MKLFFVFLFFPFVISSCDPVQLVYVKNYTNDEIKLDVKFQKQARDFDRYYVLIANTIIENPKANLKYQFSKKLPVFLTSDTNYQVNLPPNSTGLLCPLTIGFPIKGFKISGLHGSDSLSFYVSKAEMKAQLGKGKLQKVNWTFFIYNYQPLNP